MSNMYRNTIVFILSFLLLACGDNNHTGKYRIARSTSWNTIGLSGMEKNLAGFTDDLVFEIAKTKELPIEILTVNKSDIASILDSEDIDAVLGSFEITPEDRTTFEFSDPYFITGPVLVVRADSPITLLRDLDNREVGFERGEDSQLLELASSSRCIFKPYDLPIQAFDDLASSRIDGLIADVMLASKMAQGLFRDKIKIVGKPLIPINFYLITKKSKSLQIVAEFNSGLQQVQKQGLYDKMLVYWGLLSAQQYLSR